MANIEKVLKGLECCKSPMITGVLCNSCPYWDDNNPDEYQISCNDNLCADAFELLKSQQSHIEYTKEFLRQTIVRCKDCIDWDETTEECSNSDSVCFRNGWCKPDFFCADGKRKG